MPILTPSREPLGPNVPRMGASGVPLMGGLAHHNPTPGNKSISWSAHSGIVRAFQRLSKNLVAHVSHASIEQLSVNESNSNFFAF